MSRKKDWKRVFLHAYAQSGNAKESAEAAGVSEQAVYKARKTSKTFAEQFEEAREYLADDLEAVAVGRARERSDTMLIFLLKGLKPDTYADRVRHGGDPQAPIKVVVSWKNDTSD